MGTSEVSAFEKWMKYVGEYGISYIFLAATVLILIYLAVSIVGIIREWIPKLIISVIESHNRVAAAIEALVRIENTHQTRTFLIHEGVLHGIRGINLFAKKNHERLGIGSDVLVHLENAERALSREEFNIVENEKEEQNVRHQPTHPA